MDTAEVGDVGSDVLVRVLGRTALERGGEAVPLPGRRERALLAALTAHAPDTVSTTRLIEAIWNGSAPEGARQTLRAYVVTLRRALARAGLQELVVTRPGGYALVPEAVARVDCRVFETLLSEADRFAASGETEREAAALRDALTLWHGPAFADVAEAPTIAAKARRLEEARLLALERRVEAELECGHPDKLAAELAELCAEHPLRERLWKARMLALYRSGRQSEALAVYRELFDRLRGELGLQPSAEIHELQLAILRHDPALDRRARSQPSEEPSERPEPPLPPELRGPARAYFIGRESELATLETCFSLARGGSGQLVLVRGEPGIGKTSFVTHWALRAHAGGAVVLHGRCDSTPRRPYQPFAEALHGYLDSLDRPARRRLLRQRAGALPSILPELGEPHAARAKDAEAAREELFDAVSLALSEAGAERPALLVLDDLQWADDSSLMLLRHVARRIRATRVMLIAICRELVLTAEGSLSDTLRELEQEPGVTSINLSGLAAEEVAALAAAEVPVTDSAAAAALGRVIRGATDGNPLFVRHVLAHLARSPEQYFSESGELRAALPLPAGAPGMVERWLSDLEPTVIRILAAGAVVGREFDQRLLASVVGIDSGVVERAIQAGREAGLIASVEGARARFTHDLIRQSLYESLDAAERAEWHRRVGERLEQAATGVSQAATLATHFASAARRGETEKAARYAAEATRHALDQLAFEDARALAERGLHCLDLAADADPGQRCELNLLLSEACLFARDLAASKAAASRAAADARRLRSREQLVRAAELRSYLNVVGQPDSETESLCREALAALGQEEPGRAARVLAGWADHVAFGRGEGPRAERLSRQALDAARRSREDGALARALFVHGEVIGWTPRIDERLELAAELLALAEARQDARSQADARHQRALALLERGDLDGFDREVELLERLIRRAAYWYHDMYLALWRGMRALLDGRLDDVEPCAQQLLAHARHEPNVVNLYLGQLYWLARAQGRQTELRPAMLAAFEANPGIPGFRCALALNHADLYELSEASRHLDELAPDRFAALPRDTTFTMSLVTLAEVCARVGSGEHAATLYELLAPYGGCLVIATKGLACLGAVDRYLGMLSSVMTTSGTAHKRFDAACELERSSA